MSSHHNFLNAIAPTPVSQWVSQSLIVLDWRLLSHRRACFKSLSNYLIVILKLRSSFTIFYPFLFFILQPVSVCSCFASNSQLSETNTFAKNLPEKDLCFFRTRLAGRSLPSFHPQIGNLAITGSAIKVHILGIT